MSRVYSNGSTDVVHYSKPAKSMPQANNKPADVTAPSDIVYANVIPDDSADSTNISPAENGHIIYADVLAPAPRPIAIDDVYAEK